MSTLFNVGLVAAGSAVGGTFRYVIGHAVGRLAGETFPWGTLLINLSGSLFLGWLTTMFKENWTFDANAAMGEEQWRLLIAVGFTGGYTTFSSFERETYSLLRDGMAWSAILYVTGSVFVGLVAFRVGMLVAGGK